MASERMLMATVWGADIDHVEAEPIKVGAENNWVCLTLDDGTQYVLNRTELTEAIGALVPRRSAA